MIWHLYLIATSDGRIVWPDKHKENNLNILHNKKTKNKKKPKQTKLLVLPITVGFQAMRLGGILTMGNQLCALIKYIW